MLEFKEVLKETGLDAFRSFMTVGLDRTNLVVLRDAKDFHPRQNGNIVVTEVNDKTLTQVSNILTFQFNKLWGISGDDVKRYMAAMHSFVRSPHADRLLAVSGKMIGETKIRAVNGRAGINLNLSILDHLDFDVAFRFVGLRDESGNVDLGTTEKSSSDAPSFIEKLNWVYGFQTNVSFRLADVYDVKVQIPRRGDKDQDNSQLIASLQKGGPLTGSAFLKYVLAQKSEKADFTVFLVRKYLDDDKMGISKTFWKEDACVIEDHPELDGVAVPYGYDPFLVNLAHEVAHYLIDDKRGDDKLLGHHERQDVLLSQLSQTTKIDKLLVDLINGNSK